MLSPLVSWFMSPSSSSSSSTEEEEEEESLDVDNTTYESDHEKDDIVNNLDQDTDQNDTPNDHGNDHNPSSCDVDDDEAIPLALAVPDPSPAVTVAFPPAADERIAAATAATTVVTRSKRQRTANYSGALRQYQRLWTKQDEIELLKGYLDYVKQNKGATNSLQNDVASFYNDVRHKLNAGFNINQLVEKLRRLKRKHRVATDKGSSGKEVSFRSLQDEAIFEISNKIWGNDTGEGDAIDGDGSGGGGGDDARGKVKVKTEKVEDCDQAEKRALKRSRLSERKDGDAAPHIQGFIEETMRSCFSPFMKELLDDAREDSPKPVELWPSEAGDEEWRKRRISELEVYSNRLELLQDQIKGKLGELRSLRVIEL